MNIFNILPSNFFSILSSKNKEIYFDCLKIIYDLYDSKMGFDISKEDAMESLIAYFENYEEDFSNDEETGGALTPRERANYIIDKFTSCGWISIETDNNYVDILSFRFYALTIMEALNSITNVEDEMENGAFEYKGYLYSIYTLLTEKGSVEYGIIINQVHRLAVEFVSEIKKINLKLKDYILNISKQTEIKELMEMLVDYKTQLVDKSYQRLKTYDNIDRYKRRILDRLEEVYQDDVIMDRAISEYMHDKSMTYDEASYYVERSINEVIDIFNNLSDLIEEIEVKNSVYVKSTITKIKFLLNNETDIMGKLNYVLKFMTQNPSLTDYKIMNKIAPLFTMSKQQGLGMKSLYTPKLMYRNFIQQALIDMDRPDFNKLEDEFISEYDLEYSEAKILDFVERVLRKKNGAMASELFKEKPSQESLIRLLYILVYGSTADQYDINKLEKTYETDEFKINDFEIVRR